MYKIDNRALNCDEEIHKVWKTETAMNVVKNGLLYFLLYCPLRSIARRGLIYPITAALTIDTPHQCIRCVFPAAHAADL